jgi:hypothetical protein
VSFLESWEKTPMAESTNAEAAEADQPAPAVDPNHHLWRNGRLWWVAFTVHLPGWQKERIRRSLGTADVEEARERLHPVAAPGAASRARPPAGPPQRRERGDVRGLRPSA